MEEINLEQTAWYHPSWLSTDTLTSFEWSHGTWLHGLWALPLLLWLMGRLHRSYPLELAFTASEWRQQSRNLQQLLRYIPRGFALLALLLFMLALARPQRLDEHVDQWREGIDIVLAIDISRSMEIEDLRPNRLEAAKAVALEFIAGRASDRIGLVVFSGDAYSKTPLTQDYDLLRTEIQSITFGLIAQEGTAIGSALATSINRMRDSETKSKVIILLSDGENTAGAIDPRTATELAYAFEMRVYTIAIGKEGRVPWGKDFLNRTRYVESHIDIEGLKQIAELTNGRFYRATNTRTLSDIFSEIDKLERSEIKERRYAQRTDYYPVYLRWGMLCFLLFLLTRNSPMGSRLID